MSVDISDEGSIDSQTEETVVVWHAAQVNDQLLAFKVPSDICHIHHLTLIDQRESLGIDVSDGMCEIQFHRLHLSVAHADVTACFIAVEFHGYDIERSLGLRLKAQGVGG